MDTQANAYRFGSLGTWELDLSTGVLLWSDQTFFMFGVPNGTPQTFETFLARIHPEDVEDFKKIQADALKSKVAMECIHRIVRPNGDIRTVREVGELLGRSGRQLFHGIVQDITDMLAHAVNADANERLVSLAGREAQLGGWRFVPGEQHVHWSDATAAIHELPPGTSPTVDEAIAFYTPESQTRIRIAFSNCVSFGSPFDEVLAIVTQSGKQIAVRAIGEPEHDASGEIVAVFGAFQDISELVDAKDKSSKAAAHLEGRLRQSERLEAIGLMTGGVAHDFNNLLTVISGNAESLSLALPKDDKLRPLVEMIAMAAERGAELTNRLLAFSRRQPLQSKSVDVNILIHGMAALLQRAVPGYVEIELSLGDGPFVTQIDPGQLEIAVLNLVLNAKDAMTTRGRIIIETSKTILDEQYVGGRPEFVPGPYTVLCITDDGAGMAADVAAKAFDPFFTTKAVGLGTGLGLSMVYGFVKQSGGHATIYSELGKGTSIKLFLPSSDSPTLDPAIDARADADRGSEHILVVEDDVLVRQHVISTLSQLGYRTTSAASGADGLKALLSDPSIQLLFTDMVMPGGMNGRDLADQAIGLYPSLKVIFTSGYTEEAVVDRNWLDSGVHFLSKPYKRNDLASLLRRAFNNK